MKMRMLVAAGAVAAVVAVMAGAVVWAQGQGMGPHGPFGHFGHFGAFHRGLRELDLTAEQKTEIKGILKSHREELHDSLDKLRTLHQTVGKISHQQEIDEAAIRATVGQAVGPLGDLAVLHARVQQEIHAVLTPEQRQKAEALHEKLRSHVEEIRKSMHEIGDDLLEDPS
jgi:Spy/CpxP family protein refolding chaperone